MFFIPYLHGKLHLLLISHNRSDHLLSQKVGTVNHFFYRASLAADGFPFHKADVGSPQGILARKALF